VSGLAEFYAARLDDLERAAPNVHEFAALEAFTGNCSCGWPERLLRDVAAKRRILETIAFWSENSQDALASVLSDLASGYSDHPDYAKAVSS
jgi:hypothetical protein